MSSKSFGMSVSEIDPVVAGYIRSELERQQDGLELIASENFVPKCILDIQGSILTNKYAEGYPHKKYYAGCEFVESAEELAIERAKQLFGAEHANVQPHAGTTANQAVYFTVMNPGDTLLAMDLAHGGHLSHGHPLNFSGKLYKIVGYGVTRDTETIDYDLVEKLAKEHRPKVIVAGASAYPRFIDFNRFSDIASEVGAILMVDMAHIAGLVAGGVHPSPVPYADFVTTTTHKTLRGPRGALILSKEKYAKDLDRMVFPGIQGGPILQAVIAKATCFHLAMQDEFKEYARQVTINARVLGDTLTALGFRLVSGGTDNHLMLVDLRTKKITGKEAVELLETVGITANKNMIPFDPEKPMITSGIRFGSQALTTRGLGVKEMKKIAELIDRTITLRNDKNELEEVKKEVRSISREFPLYENLQIP